MKTYYAMMALQHEKQPYAVGERLTLSDKQAQTLTLMNKITPCSRAAILLQYFNEALSAQNRAKAEVQYLDSLKKPAKKPAKPSSDTEQSHV